MMRAAGWRGWRSRRRPRNAGQRKVRQHVMRIERLVSCPPKELWWALIENAEATERGVMLRLALPGGVSQVAGKITRYESPTLLECCCDGNVLRWELEPRCEGTTHVVFTHEPDTGHLLACLDSIIAAGQQRSSGTCELSSSLD